MRAGRSTVVLPAAISILGHASVSDMIVMREGISGMVLITLLLIRTSSVSPVRTLILGATRGTQFV
jgi:hypothetical protein